MGARRVTEERWMLLICTHHAMDGWSTSHKAEEREWLAKLHGE